MAKVAAIQTQYILQMPQIQHKMQALQHDIQYTNTRNKETQVAFQEKTTSLLHHILGDAFRFSNSFSHICWNPQPIKNHPFGGE